MSQSGSVPMSLHGSQTNIYQGDELETERKNELAREVAGLLKKKNDLVIEVGRLVKTQEELVANEKNYRREMGELREKEFAAYEEEKSRILERQRIRERDLDSREQKIGNTLSELLDIYEYLEVVQDDLVWESSQNDAREKELDERAHNIIVKEKTVDFNAEQAEQLLNQAQLTLSRAKEHEEVITKEKADWVMRRLKENKDLELERDRLNQKEKWLKGRIEAVKEKEKELTADRASFEFRKKQLDKALKHLNDRV